MAPSRFDFSMADAGGETSVSNRNTETHKNGLIVCVSSSIICKLTQRRRFVFVSRRTTSGSKFSQLFRANAADSDEINLLLNGLNEMAVTSKLTAKIADSQLRGVETLERWARRPRNCAMDDVMQRTKELFEMYCEKQMQFAKDFDHFLQELRKIAATERQVQQYEQEVAKPEAKVNRLKKQVSSSPNSLFRKKSRSEREQLRIERDTVIAELEIARHELRKARANMEVAKMFHFRRGWMARNEHKRSVTSTGVSDIHRNLSVNCRQIFGCQREITELVPPISTQDLYTMLYEDALRSRERVEEVVYNPPPPRQRSEPRRHSDHLFGTPPSSYTATTQSETLISGVRQCFGFSDSHIMASRRQADSFVSTPTRRPHQRVAPTAPAALQFVQRRCIPILHNS
ncbi:hypothetical protein M3Y98_00339500 [Aphelenchoides besseyi]|nr:hypothetical protein M3Y98_00339300 [Aphelenchoides besseyi]KAI6188295.1 hypothetical protein M3Y98_00339500 [Aphelenchoides besseyi]